MKKVIHGDLTFDVLDDWVDASQIGYLEPPDSSLADELAKQAAASGAPMNLQMPASPKTRTNFMFSTRPWFLPDVDHKVFADKELRAMMAQVPGAKGSGHGWTKLGDAVAATAELEVEMEGVRAKQLHVLGVLGDRILHFCGTTSPGDFDAAKPGLLEVVASVKVNT